MHREGFPEWAKDSALAILYRTRGKLILASGYENAERMAGRIGVDVQRLVQVIRTIKTKLSP